MLTAMAKIGSWAGWASVGLWLLPLGAWSQVTNVWDGGGTDNNWGTGANWVSDAVPANGTNLTFTGTVRTLTTNDLVGLTVGKIIMTNAANGFTLSGNPVTFGVAGAGGGIEILAGSAPLTVNLDLVMAGDREIRNPSAATVTINGNISETGGARTLSKSSSGVLVLNGSNTFTGPLSIVGGQIQINSLADSGVASAAGSGSTLIGGAGGNTGTLRYLGAGAASDRRVQIGRNSGSNPHTGGATIESSGTGSMVFTAPTFNAYESGNVTNSRTLTLGGTYTGAPNEIQGKITNNKFDGANFSATTGVVALTKAGAGTWILSGTNEYTGLTTVSGGALRAANGSALGTADQGTTVSSGGALELAGGIGIASEALTISGTGVSGGGALRNVSGTNTFGGTVALGAAGTRINSDSGLLRLTNAAGVTGNFNLLVGGAGDTALQGGFKPASGAASLTKDGAGTLTLGGTSGFRGALTVESGTLRHSGAEAFGGALSNGVWIKSGTWDLNGFDQTVDAGFGRDLKLGGGAAGTSASIATGGGTLFLTNGVAAQGARVYYESDNNPLGATLSGKIANAPGGVTALTFFIEDSSATDEELVVSADITWTNGSAVVQRPGAAASGVLVLSGSNNFGNVRFEQRNGTLVVRNDRALGNPGGAVRVGYAQDGAALSRLYVDAGHTLDHNLIIVSRSNTFASAERTLGTLSTSGEALFTGEVRLEQDVRLSAASGGTARFQGAIVDQVAAYNPSVEKSVTKIGEGTVILEGANTYSGATILSNGTLRVNGSHFGGGQYTVASGGTLGGTGMIDAAINVLAGGIVAPGNSIGTLTTSNSFDLDGTLQIELANTAGPGGASDLLDVNGLFDISGGTLQFIYTGALTNDFYIFAAYDTLAGPFGSVTLPDGYGLDYNYLGNNQIALVIPEPSTFALLGLGALALLGVRRRKKITG